MGGSDRRHIVDAGGRQVTRNALNEKAILVVNTGSTSTKCSIFRIADEELVPVSAESISHTDGQLLDCPDIPSQKPLRQSGVEAFLESALPSGMSIAAIGAIGGMLLPVPSGVIAIDRGLASFCLESPVYHHASNLAAPIAHEMGLRLGCPSYAVDPVGVDEMNAMARISGSPLFPRFSFVHALNIRATAR